jgi:hypothetical protein
MYTCGKAYVRNIEQNESYRTLFKQSDRNLFNTKEFAFGCNAIQNATEDKQTEHSKYHNITIVNKRRIDT